MSIKITKTRAFTMAEAILVMTILGIIATIMITTLKPAQYKTKGLEIAAKRVIQEFETALEQVKTNNFIGYSNNKITCLEPKHVYRFDDGTTCEMVLYKSDGTTGINDCFHKALMKYLRVKRGKYEYNAGNICDIINTIDEPPNFNIYPIVRYNFGCGGPSTNNWLLSSGELINGAYYAVVIKTNGRVLTAMYPGDQYSCIMPVIRNEEIEKENACSHTSNDVLAVAFIDVNGLEEGPNLEGKDIFALAIDLKLQIRYDVECQM